MHDAALFRTMMAWPSNWHCMSTMLGEQEKELPPLDYHTAALGSIEEQDLGCKCKTILAFKFTHDFTKRGQKHLRHMQVIGYMAALTLVHDL